MTYIKANAKAIAALVVGAVVSYATLKGLKFDPLWVGVATGVVTSVIVWFTRNTPAP